MKETFYAVFLILTMNSVYAQTTDTVIVGGDTMIVFSANSPADKLFRSGDVYGAIESFRSMFKAGENHLTEVYNYACALSVAYQMDSAFKYLTLAVVDDSSTYPLTDPDLLNLRKGKQWNDFESKQIAAIQMKQNNAITDVEYAKRLWYMLASDQAYFKCIELAEDKIGRNSTVVLALWELKNIINDQNQKELEQLIEAKGWPRKSQVGKEAADAAFLVIQHSTPEKQKKYLPVIKILCENDEANWGSYALMYDRIQISDNKPQKYGSQVRFNAEINMYELYPLLDETKVDQWRKEVGLGPLANYVSRWGISFEPKRN
jgi:hypothetical protein